MLVDYTPNGGVHLFLQLSTLELYHFLNLINAFPKVLHSHLDNIDCLFVVLVRDVLLFGEILELFQGRPIRLQADQLIQSPNHQVDALVLIIRLLQLVLEARYRGQDFLVKLLKLIVLRVFAEIGPQFFSFLVRHFVVQGLS